MSTRRLRNLVLPLLLFASLCFTGTAPAVEFRFRHEAGEKWHITSTVREEVYIDGAFEYAAEILSRIAAETVAESGRIGTVDALYQIAEWNSVNGVYAWSSDYRSRFDRDERGRMSLHDPRGVVPLVRDVPVFPEKSIEPGDAWSSPGREVFDLRPGFGIDDLLVLDFSAQYRYVGPRTLDDRPVELIRIRYGFDWSVDPMSVPLEKPHWGRVYPVAVEGTFEVDLWWDNEAGKPYVSESAFRYDYLLNTGEVDTFLGASRGRAVYAAPMDRDALVREIEEKADLAAEAVEEGVKVTLENIHFYPDSPEMLPGEEAKLHDIAEILSDHPGRDILITGHTARVGTEESSQILSEARAATVARFFLDLGTRSTDEIVTRGMGSQQPVGDNATESGRRRNRRVEITILEN